LSKIIGMGDVHGALQESEQKIQSHPEGELEPQNPMYLGSWQNTNAWDRRSELVERHVLSKRHKR